MIENADGFYLSPNSEEIRQVHALQLELLLETDRICRRHDINYYLLFGSLLGAVRHGGFIPWDDDMDIGLLRPDYDRLLTILETELDGTRYVLQTAENDAGLSIPYAKIRCRYTAFIEKAALPSAEFHQGVFIDLFPLDRVPDDHKAQNRLKQRYLLTHFALRYKLDHYRSERWWVNLIYRMAALSDIPSLLTKRRNVMTSCRNDQSGRVIAFPASRADYDTSFLFRAELDPPSELDFCGYRLMAPAAADVQLRSLFGDYMHLPPESERHGHLLRAFDIDTRFWADVLDRHRQAVRTDSMGLFSGVREVQGGSGSSAVETGPEVMPQPDGLSDAAETENGL